jgi:hypothetical protein
MSQTRPLQAGRKEDTNQKVGSHARPAAAVDGLSSAEEGGCQPYVSVRA